MNRAKLTATIRAAAEYWLSASIAAVADLWREETGRHRRGWREPSTFEFAADEWGRMARVIEATPRPVLTPLEAPKPPTFMGGTTIGQRARLRGAADTHEFVRSEFDRIVTAHFADGTQGYAIGDPTRLEREAA